MKLLEIKFRGQLTHDLDFEDINLHWDELQK